MTEIVVEQKTFGIGTVVEINERTSVRTRLIDKIDGDYDVVAIIIEYDDKSETIVVLIGRHHKMAGPIEKSQGIKHNNTSY